MKTNLVLVKNARSGSGKEEETNVTMDDAEGQWELIRDQWAQLELDDVLARDSPPAKRWQLDLLLRRMRGMDRIFEKRRVEQFPTDRPDATEFNLSLSDLPPFLSGADEELFRVTAKMVVELQDYGGTDASGVAEILADECSSLVARHGERTIEQMARLILASEIRSLSSSFQSLFDSFNEKYFAGALARYQIHVVFDLHTIANEPGGGSDGLIRFAERRIFIRYTDADSMQETLLHEMAHAATGGEHDSRFLAEMARLKVAGAAIPDWELEP